jgi:hypothetical protein
MDYESVLPSEVRRSDAGARIYLSISNDTGFEWMPDISWIVVWWETDGWLLRARGSGRVKLPITQRVPSGSGFELPGVLLPLLTPDHQPDALVVAVLSNNKYTELARLKVE